MTDQRMSAEAAPNGRDRFKPVGKPRACARCERPFQPTVTRRMLCAPCHGDDGTGHWKREEKTPRNAESGAKRRRTT